MILERCLADALRAALVLGLGLGSMPLLRRASAETRRLLLALALGGALIVPAASSLAPSWRVGTRASLIAPSGEPFLEPLVESGPALAVPAGAPALRSPRVHAPASVPLDPGPILAVVWALGALAVVARLLVGVGRARRMVKRAAPAPTWAAAVARAARVTGLRADVRETGDLDAPAVTGVLSPVILVPRASTTWSEARRFAVLLHELAHVRRQDCLVQILAQLACAAHWFDPLVWIAARRLRVERELAADDAVLTAGARASTYAEDLLAIAGDRAAPSSALGMAERSELAARVTAIVAAGQPRRPLSRPRTALLVASAAAVLSAVACATPEPATRPPEPTSPALSTPSPAPAASTLDRRIQQIADEEIDRTVAEWQPAAAAIVVLDPTTGEILANAGRAGGAAADVAVARAFITGSTIKAVTLAAALDEGVLAATDRFDCTGGATYGARQIHDAEAHGVLTVPEMLAVSSNIGFAKVFDRLGGDRLGRWLHRFHFGSPPAIAGAAGGELPARVEDRSYEGAMFAIGEAIKASPLQVAAAYAAIANDGAYVAPSLTHRPGAPPREQLIRPETARAVVAMLEEAVGGERATGKEARLAGVRVAGKTGTASYPLPGGGEGIYASFVGIVPADHPRFVILVGVEQPRDGGWGGKVAAPAFARVASRALGNGG